MATLREIRRQLHSVENIRKITQAMEMVAASRLRRAQAKAEMSRPYSLKLKEILLNLIAAETDQMHPLLRKRVAKKIGLIVIAGDRGLCGSYNQAVFSTAEKMLKKYSADQVELFVIGRKTVDYFSEKIWKIRQKVVDWGGKLTYSQAEVLTQQLIHLYLNHELDEIWLIYTRYLSIATRTVMIEKLLNLENEQFEEKSRASNFIYEPSVTEIIDDILPIYCMTKVQNALNEAYASELAARIFSMRAATKNAEERIDSLTLIRNKIRQTGITRELLEITSCVESLK